MNSRQEHLSSPSSHPCSTTLVPLPGEMPWLGKLGRSHAPHWPGGAEGSLERLWQHPLHPYEDVTT